VNKITTIIFDFGNVIAFFDRMKTCQKLVKFSSYSADEIYAKIFESELEPEFDQGKTTPQEFFQLIINAISLNKNIDFKFFCEIWNDIFELNLKMEKLIKLLKQKGYRLALLSNANKLHSDFFREKFSVLNLFDKFIFSHLKGYHKPDFRMWTESGERLENCIYVDDIELYARSSEEAGVAKAFIYNAKHHEEFEKELLEFLNIDKKEK